MDGKLLVLCDELPKTYEHYKVRDVYFLRQELIDPEDDPEKIFVTWDAIIPKDKSFIAACIGYARSYEDVPLDFAFKQKGEIDPKNGTICGSIQESSYLEALNSNISRVRNIALAHGDYLAEAIDLASQFVFQATDKFLGDFSKMLNNKGVVRVLATHKNTTDPNEIRHRTQILEAWQNKNRLMKENQANAELVEPMVYDAFGEVYIRANEEMLKVYSLPIFGPKM